MYVTSYTVGLRFFLPNRCCVNELKVAVHGWVKAQCVGNACNLSGSKFEQHL